MSLALRASLVIGYASLALRASLVIGHWRYARYWPSASFVTGLAASMTRSQ